MRTLLGMQYGGGVPQQLQDGGVSSGLAYLRRGQKRKEAYNKARDAESRLMEKRKKSGFLGSLGGLGGGLLGAALVGSGLGIPLALAAGLGTAGGRYLGSRAGYGKDFEVEDDVMYGEEAGLEDIGAAGESYESGMGQEAMLSGVKAGLMAGIAPGGGIYGKTSKWAEGLRGAGGAGVLAPTEAYKASLGFDLPEPIDTGSGILPPAPDITTGGLTQAPKSLSDAIPATLRTDSSSDILAKASSISSKAPEAQFPLRLGSGGLDMDLEAVNVPSPVGEEYAIARDSSNLKKQMLELKRRLGLNIARAEGGLDNTITDQGIRESTLGFNPDINLQSVNMPEGIRPQRIFDPTVEPDLSKGNWLLEHGADSATSTVTPDTIIPNASVSEPSVISDSLMGLTDDFAMPVDTSVVAPSYADALANRGQYQGMINKFFQQYNPNQRSAENWMSMFQQPQFAGLMGGGSVLQSPRTLLGFVG